MSQTVGRRARLRPGISLTVAAGLAAATFAIGVGRSDHAAAQQLAGGKVAAKIDGSTLNVKGGSANDTIVLRLKTGDPAVLVVDVPSNPGSTRKFDRSRFDSVLVDGGAGDDTIGVDESNGAFADEAVTLAGGDGDDTLVGGSEPDRFVWNAGNGDDVIDGGGGNDTVEANGNGEAEGFTATANGTRVRFDRVSPDATFLDIGAVESLIVNAKGGNDTFSATGNLAALIAITVDGGSGDDELRGSNGADLLIGGGGSDFIDGNQGADSAFGGGGADTFQWDPGDGNDIIEGQDGADTLLSNGANIAELFDVSANGDRVRFSRNIGNIVMDVAGVETLALKTLGGADVVTVNNLAGTGMKRVNVSLAGFDGTGDAAADSVVVNGTDAADKIRLISDDTSAWIDGLAEDVTVTGADVTGDRFTVDGMAGDDVFNPNQLGSYPIQFVAEGGEGTEKITVNGTDANETFSVTANGTLVRVDRLSPTPFNFDIGSSEGLVINGNGGDDSFSATGNLAALIPLTFNGGGGNDTILGGNGADVLIGGDGNDFIDGNQGADTALMGGGDDTFQWDPGDGNDVVEGQAGLDSLIFNGANIAELIDLSPDGGRVRLTRNIANIVMDLNGIENATIKTLGGADTVTVNSLAGTALKDVNVNLAQFDGNGDTSADTVVVYATDRAEVILVNGTQGGATVSGLAANVEVTGGESALDRLVINAQGGDDIVNATGTDGTSVQLTLDGGEGDDVLDGGGGNDTILGGNGDDVIAGGPGLDILDGGTGDNVVIQD